MSRSLIAVLICLSTLAAPGQGQNPVSPYPHGSPFPPGKEPKLTHVAKAYWSTLDGLTTEVRVRAKGHRPTQLEFHKFEKGELKGIHGGIDPECDYTIRIVAAKGQGDEDRGAWVQQGQGMLIVRVYGHNASDFDQPPQMEVRYLKDGKLVGATMVESRSVTRDKQ